MSYMGGAYVSYSYSIPYYALIASKPPLRMKKLLGETAQMCYAGSPCFLNIFFLHFKKTYAMSQS